MTLADDWFYEPEPEPTLNELYTRRLKAWGWLYTDGVTPDWEVSSMRRLRDTTVTSYLPPMKKVLDSDLAFLRLLQVETDALKPTRERAWTKHPEWGPA